MTGCITMTYVHAHYDGTATVELYTVVQYRGTNTEILISMAYMYTKSPLLYPFEFISSKYLSKEDVQYRVSQKFAPLIL